VQELMLALASCTTPRDMTARSASSSLAGYCFGTVALLLGFFRKGAHEWTS
jgi:hypothetical protein